MNGTHLGSRRNAKCSLNSAKVLEVELECSVARVACIRKDHCSIPTLLLHFHHKLQGTVKLSVELSALEHEEAVAKFSGEHVPLDLEAVDADFVPAPFGGDHVLEERQVFFKAVVLVLKGLHLSRELRLRRLFDLQS